MIDTQNFLKKDVSELSGLELKALWWDGHGEWQKAHDLVDGPSSQSAARVHAYLHRKEGDIWNADYWYRRAGEVRPDHSLDEEWEGLVARFYKH
ncbi:hypothetical protein [Algoriphagus sediminis]|uniref:Uncharacterized protein n=1 Tax=Algoriphagus sediminis TaxID=3057113 RepID=A0ABT7Y9R5_9BACT|nr:hypothetical protein [Algoriphagus sediminis]MDN3203248.1 hypothetical protein [Algoriphagus sediminis]